MNSKPLVLEILSGPRDGEIVTLEASTDWGRTGAGPLSFPWDSELGDPQAHVTADEKGWWLEPVKARHGTHNMSEGERVTAKTRLATGDVLRANRTWLVVRQAE